jgi:sporulation protein YunB
MVYIRKNKKKLVFRVFLICFAAFFLLAAMLRAVNMRVDNFIRPLARTGITREITRLINEAVTEALAGGGYGELAEAVYDEGGRVRSVHVDSLGLNLFRADVSVRVAEKLSRLEKFYVEVDISNILDEEIFFGDCSFSVSVDVIPVGGVETDVKSEFISAGINQTNYRLSLNVAAEVTADVISAFTVDVATSVNIVDMLIVGDVPTVVWG